jgi:hypothetical protein
MAYSKKISELPVRQQCNPTDIVPVVDAAETQTSTVTTAMIAALGGGRPGNDTIENACYKTNSITYPKLQATTGGNVLLGRISNDATPSSGIIAEVPCSAWVAANVLPKTNQQDFVSAIGAGIAQGNALFTGPIRAANGSITQPSFGNTGSGNTYGGTGIYFPSVVDGANTYTLGLGLVVDGSELFRVNPDGSLLSTIPGVFDGNGNPVPPSVGFVARAWVKFNGANASGVTTVIYMDQRAVATRYGRDGTLRADSTTLAHLQWMESQNGSNRTATFVGTTPSTNTGGNIAGTNLEGLFSYNSNSYPKYKKGSTGRPNYYTTSDNFHWAWSGPDATGGWGRVAASSGDWIAGVVVTTSNTSYNPIFGAGGISSIAFISTGVYRIYFSSAMPDTNYAVVGTCGANGTAPGSIAVTDAQTTYCQITTLSATGASATPGAVYNPSNVNIAIMR